MTENLSRPITKGEKTMSLNCHSSRNFEVSNFAHVIMTAVRDAKQSFENYGLVGCHYSRSNDLAVHARIDSTSYVRLL